MLGGEKSLEIQAEKKCLGKAKPPTKVETASVNLDNSDLKNLACLVSFHKTLRFIKAMG